MLSIYKSVVSIADYMGGVHEHVHTDNTDLKAHTLHSFKNILFDSSLAFSCIQQF